MGSMVTTLSVILPSFLLVRAMDTIEGQGLLDEDEAQGAGRVLKAAAMTYVAALLTSLLQLLRFLLIFLGRGGGDRRGGRR